MTSCWPLTILKSGGSDLRPRRGRDCIRFAMLLQNNYAERHKSAAPGQARAPRHFVPLRSLTDPDPVEQKWPQTSHIAGHFSPSPGGEGLGEGGPFGLLQFHVPLNPNGGVRSLEAPRDRARRTLAARR